jgi:hypothetical protein
MRASVLLIAILLGAVTYTNVANAQSNKNKKSRYYQSNAADEEFNVKGYDSKPVKNELQTPKNEVDTKPVEPYYSVDVTTNEKEKTYKRERKIRTKVAPKTVRKMIEVEVAVVDTNDKHIDRYPTTYGSYRNYRYTRKKYDKYYVGKTQTPEPIAKPVERVLKMTKKEKQYETTVVKKRYTNLDILCDDLDLAKIQRPVFKGICTECDKDVDAIIVNKNMQSLDKNYELKQCYMMRDKRLRETLDDDQYKKWLRIKDDDDYLIITKNLELKDGVNN